jgi:hypothetical protein
VSEPLGSLLPGSRTLVRQLNPYHKMQALVQWCSGAVVQWCSGAVVQWCSGAVVRQGYGHHCVVNSGVVAGVQSGGELWYSTAAWQTAEPPHAMWHSYWLQAAAWVPAVASAAGTARTLAACDPGSTHVSHL